MRFTRPVVATALTAATALLFAGTAPADAKTAPLAPHTTFTMDVNETTGAVTPPASGEDIPNVDSVKSAIRAYYNASGGLANRTSSNYITEVDGIVSDIEDAYPKLTGSDIGTKAVVFDTDDTLLWNYDYEDKGSNFNYNGTTNAQWVTGSACNAADGTDFGAVKTGDFCFPAVPGTPDLVKDLYNKGYALYVITGRPSDQKTATIDNLAAAGFTTDGTAAGDPIFTDANVYTKWLTGATTYSADEVPSYIKSGECSTAVSGIAHSYKCTTVEYKAQTREHIEDADGVDIVGNIGDQLSDLWGGYADHAWKIPNPTYFLSSPNLDAVHIGDDDQSADLTLPSTFTMAPTTTAATAATEGDEIPNIDPVRTEIRAYYNATGGVASKTSSNYISELTDLTGSWTKQITTSCQRQTKAIAKAKHKITVTKKAIAKAKGKKAKSNLRKKLKHISVPTKPAAVFDADDTTLWNYDLEDSVMQFVYSSATSSEWVHDQKFPAVPGMVSLVKKVKAAGCTIFGVTGRPGAGQTDDQTADTVANLAKVGYVDAKGKPLFTAARFYTKPATMPSYVDCGDDGSCSTIEYKSGTRGHIEKNGFDIVANLGDQFSDLIGGYADKTYKVPNPTYYLP